MRIGTWTAMLSLVLATQACTGEEPAPLDTTDGSPGGAPGSDVTGDAIGDQTGDAGDVGGADTTEAGATEPTWWSPGLAATWQWQLLGDIDTTVDADVYDVDLFDAPDAVLTQLHAGGRRVVCYFSAGSSEDWRPDFGDLPKGALGEPLDGWEGERWLDVRIDGVRAVMRGRLDLAASRGCDGVEPDNVDGWANQTGFGLTAADQLAYNGWLAQEAHARGLAVALKNDGDQVKDLVGAFDLAVVEQCVEFDECGLYAPFVAGGKPVFVAEYRDDLAAARGARGSVCASVGDGYHVLLLPLDLDGSFRVSCDE